MPYANCNECESEFYWECEGDCDVDDYGCECDSPGECDECCSAPTEVETSSSQLAPLWLPTLAEREVRLVSFEQECSPASAGGVERIASALFNSGFSATPGVLSYSSSSEVDRERDDYASPSLCHVEHDGSCGGEIIWSRLNLSDKDTARRVEEGFALVRSHIDRGDVKLSAKCGFHVHESLQGFSMANVENLYHSHNYLESFLFAIGSAFWSAHRSEITSYTGYSAPTVKGVQGKKDIGRILGNGRGALNLSNYLSAARSCNCGAFLFEDWENCSCRLPKPTVEFRWPNATANIRKARAYAAVTLSLLAACKRASAGEFSELPADGFANTTQGRDYGSVADWLAANLAMSRSEWQDLAYVVRNSPGIAASDSLARYLETTSTAITSHVVAIGV